MGSMMKMQQRFGLVLVVMMAACFGVCLGAGFYGSNSAVISLTRSNFAQKVLNDDHVWLVEFYAPWCGHCQRLTPEWEKAAANLKGLVRVGAINCDEEKEFCGGFGIQGFPTIKLFPSEKTGANKKPVDYQQQRTAAAIVKFALGFLPNYSTTLTAANAEKFLAQDKPKVLLFSNKPETTSLWKALTVDFKGRLNFAEVKHTQKALVDQFEIKNYPTLIVVKEGGEKVVYDGKLAHEDIFKFLSPFAPAQQQQSSSSGQQKPVEDLPAAVHEVKTQADFEKHCTSKAGSCVIAFLDTEDEEGKRKERDLAMLLKLAEKYKKSFHFVWMDGSKNFELADALGTTLLPSLSVYNHGKKAYVPLFGAFEEKALGEYLNKVLTNKKPAVPVPLTRPLPAVSSS